GIRQVLATPLGIGATLEIEHCSSDVSSGALATQRLLERRPDVTGIMSYNDVIALGVLQAARARGRAVPRDVSVVGFDDIPLARYAEPALTTIAQDIAGLAIWAVDRLLGTLAAEGSGTTEQVAGAAAEPMEGPEGPEAPGRLPVYTTWRVPVHLV